ncbi:MAG: 50S ribosomal protein L18 [Candidatus Thiosymbion ectosymbiont of Robbea hypermnestra]|nr:50S ribosomal protein L18 [Candidatus Thiosymbion ectosymbiont of Robbea hypermnestra]
MDKKQARMRRAARARAKIRELGAYRLCVFRTPRHIYAQVIEPDGSRVVASASTLDKEYRRSGEGHAGNAAAAAVVGRTIAERAKSAGIEKVAFDRSGFRYHGRVKALAEAAREHGLQF